MACCRATVPQDGQQLTANEGVSTQLTRDAIKASPVHDSEIPLERDFETQLYTFHGKAGYWSSERVASWLKPARHSFCGTTTALSDRVTGGRIPVLPPRSTRIRVLQVQGDPRLRYARDCSESVPHPAVSMPLR